MVYFIVCLRRKCIVCEFIKHHRWPNDRFQGMIIGRAMKIGHHSKYLDNIYCICHLFTYTLDLYIAQYSDRAQQDIFLIV